MESLYNGKMLENSLYGASVDVYGRQKLESSCTLPYSNQWAEFVASLPYASIFLFMSLSRRNNYPMPYYMACLSLFGVEVTHAMGHLLLFPYAEETIILFYFFFNLFFMHIVYTSSLTADSWWRYIYRTKEMFMAGYIFGALLLIWVWGHYGYLISTTMQSFIQIGVASTTALSTEAARRAMRKWTGIYLVGVVLLVTEIIGCAYFKEALGLFPYHACVDLVMGISCYFHSIFICSLHSDSNRQERKEK